MLPDSMQRIVIPDGGYDASIMADAAANSTFNASVRYVSST